MSRINGFASLPALNPLGGHRFTVTAPPVSHESGPLLFSNCEDGQPLSLPCILERVQQMLPQPLIRVGATLLIPLPEGEVRTIKDSSQLVAHIGNFANIDWRRGSRYFAQKDFFEFIFQQSPAYDAIECFPHEPSAEKIYYHHPTLSTATNRYLPQFLNFFALASAVDQTLFESFVLSMCVCLPGGKPMFVLMNSSAPDNAAEARDTGRGVGKSTAVALVGEVFGGFIEISSNSDEDKLRSRFLSDGATGKRLVRIDNVKSDRMSCAMIEKLITAPEVSGHRYFKGEGCMPNHFVYAMTVNGPNLSEDLASRSILIKCQRPAYDPGWEDRVRRFIDENRWNLISDIIAKLKSPRSVTFDHYGRFSSWEEKVLARCTGAEAALSETCARRRSIDADFGAVLAIQDLRK